MKEGILSSFHSPSAIKLPPKSTQIKPSTIKPAISTIERKLVLKKLGMLSPDDLASLDSALKELLSMG